MHVCCEMTEKSKLLHIFRSVYLLMMCAGTQERRLHMQQQRPMKITYGFIMLGQIVPHTQCSNKQ